VGASATEAVAYLSSNMIAMPPAEIASLQVGFEPGEVALVSAVDARRAQTAAKLQEAGSSRILTHNLPTAIPQPDGTMELPAPMQPPQLVPSPTAP